MIDDREMQVWGCRPPGFAGYGYRLPGTDEFTGGNQYLAKMPVDGCDRVMQ